MLTLLAAYDRLKMEAERLARQNQKMDQAMDVVHDALEMHNYEVIGPREAAVVNEAFERDVL